MSLQKIIEEVKALTPDEQRKLRELLDELLKSPPLESKEEELQRKLFEAGIISEIKLPSIDVEAFRDYKPIKVKGKPVSETIIEERR